MATTWPFWNEKRISDVYENIYIRTFVEDWYVIVNRIASEIDGVDKITKKILDLGAGEGHTAKQILDRVKTSYVCDIVEPDEPSLEKARQFLSLENNLGRAWVGGIADISQKNMYDVIYTSHTNYYWGISAEDYDQKLRSLIDSIESGGKLLILTLPEDSAHYKVMLHQIYPVWNYSEHMINFYKNLNYQVDLIA